MKNNLTFTKTLAIFGATFACLPLLAPLLFSVIRFVQSGRIQFDYLMPAEIFPVALLGGGLLIWAAVRTRRRRALLIWSVVAQILLLVGSQALAVLTGLASGTTDTGTMAWAFVVALLVLFILAMVTSAVAGILLLRDLFTPLSSHNL